MQTRLTRALLLVVIVIWLPPVGWRCRAGELGTRSSSSDILNVVASDCRSGPRQRSLTGFRVKGRMGLVTALHGVVGCATISAHPSDESPSLRDLRLTWVDVDRDVAVLESPSIDAKQGGLTLPPAVGVRMLQRLQVIGHPAGLTMQLKSAALALRDPPIERIGHLIPPGLHDKVRARASPRIDIDVLNIEGILTSGHSGAPLLDAAGRVIGIANGGLAQGYNGIVWAIPWSAVALQAAHSRADDLQRLAVEDANLVFSFPADQGTEGQLDMSVGVMSPSQPPDSSRVEYYVSQTTSSGISITSKLGYLDNFEAGGVIRPLKYWDYPFEAELANMDLKVVNNTDRTIYFTGAVFEVERSTPDPWPLLVIKDDSKACHPGEIMIVNDGWGPARDAMLRFDVRPPTSEEPVGGRPEAVVTPNGPRAAQFRHSVPIPEFLESVMLDVSSELAREGLNVSKERLRGTGRDQLRSRAMPLPPEYAGGFAVLEGELEFSGHTRSGIDKKHVVRILAPVALENRCPSGAPLPPTAQYDVELRTEGTNYRVEVPISQYLKPGEPDRFNIRVWVPQSSVHEFRIRLVYGDASSVVSPPIRLETFVSRLFARIQALSRDRSRASPDGR